VVFRAALSWPAWAGRAKQPRRNAIVRVQMVRDWALELMWHAPSRWIMRLKSTQMTIAMVAGRSKEVKEPPCLLLYLEGNEYT